jgi:hypothetical protein
VTCPERFQRSRAETTNGKDYVIDDERLEGCAVEEACMRTQWWTVDLWACI